MLRLLPLMAVCLATGSLVWAETSSRPAFEAGDAPEQSAAHALSRQISGSIVFCRNAKVCKVEIGQQSVVDLGDGEFARWSADGRQLAVYYKGDIFVMKPDGSDRRRLARGDRKDGCPIEFLGSNRIMYWSKSGFRSVRTDGRRDAPMNLPGVCSGEPCASTDASRLAVRWDRALYAVDLAQGTHRKYALGCSSGISPSGKRLMNNIGTHRAIEVRDWDGGNLVVIENKGMKADRQWDNHHWSNHEDFIAAQGEGGRQEAYVVRLSTGEATRVTWCGKVTYPDLFVNSPPLD